MTELFMTNGTTAGLFGITMTAAAGVQFCEDPAFVWNSNPAQERRVALVSGGGAGHEPMHAGFVGRGGLDAAVPGAVFTSPHNRQIYAASEKVALPEGVLQIVKNYTGDVLNFSIAAERLRSNGIPVEQVIVDDDWGSRDAGEVGRRGTAATVVVEKVLGAAADAGLSLSALAELGREIVAASRTVAVAAGAHHSPGSGAPAFDVPSGELEYGVGIHGEPARERVPAVGLPELVRRMVAELVADLAVPDGVVVLVNGLGGIGQLELAHIADATVRALVGRHVTVRSVVSGAYCTALDMRGFSITTAAADNVWLPYWFADHGTSGLPRPQEFSGIPESADVDGAAATTEEPSRWLADLAQRVEQRRAGFNALDQAAGDGDFGDNIAAGVSKAVQRSTAGDDLAADIEHLASAFLDDVGGSSGPLLGLIFGGLTARTEGAGAAELPKALLFGLTDALTAVQRAGGAQRGDRTMVDALAGLIDDATGRGQDVLDEAAVRAAIGAAAGTRQMTAKRGRAAYVGDRALGEPDPGAVAVAWLTVRLWAALGGENHEALEAEADRLLPSGR
jgi:dihydroxyacetone kinase